MSHLIDLDVEFYIHLIRQFDSAHVKCDVKTESKKFKQIIFFFTSLGRHATGGAKTNHVRGVMGTNQASAIYSPGAMLMLKNLLPTHCPPKKSYAQPQGEKKFML